MKYIHVDVSGRDAHEIMADIKRLTNQGWHIVTHIARQKVQFVAEARQSTPFYQNNSFIILAKEENA